LTRSKDSPGKIALKGLEKRERGFAEGVWHLSGKSQPRGGGKRGFTIELNCGGGQIGHELEVREPAEDSKGTGREAV